MQRNASEGLVLVHEESGKVSVVEINSETDFVAKNKDFINFCKEISKINFHSTGDLDKIKSTKMKNGSTVNENLITLIAKIGEKLQLEDQNSLTIKMGKIFFIFTLPLKRMSEKLPL